MAGSLMFVTDSIIQCTTTNKYKRPSASVLSTCVPCHDGDNVPHFHNYGCASGYTVQWSHVSSAEQINDENNNRDVSAQPKKTNPSEWPNAVQHDPNIRAIFTACTGGAT